MKNEVFKSMTSGEDIDLKSWTFGEGGPRYFIIAGLHGDEPTSIHVAMELIERLDGQEVDGTIEILPLANRLAFLAKSRTNLDERDLNRNFPGSAHGSITERLASKIWELASKADYVLDLHCCGMNSSPYILATHQQHNHSKRFASTLGVDVCIQSSGIDKNQLFAEASKNEIPAAIIEIPGGGESGWKPIRYVREITDAVLQSLQQLQFVEGMTHLDVSPRFAGELTEIYTHQSGIFTPLTSPGVDLAPTEPMGVINEETEIILSSQGRLVFTSPEKFVLQGDVVGRYVTYEKAELQ